MRTDGDRLDLYFGTIKVGVVTGVAGDFPNLWGRLTCGPALKQSGCAAVARLVRFLALNRVSTRLADQEPGHTSRVREAVDAELEARFADYAESEDWHMIDTQGRKRPILCPILRWDGEIVWRWNPGSG
jgi:hypothetical protein